MGGGAHFKSARPPFFCSANELQVTGAAEIRYFESYIPYKPFADTDYFCNFATEMADDRKPSIAITAEMKLRRKEIKEAAKALLLDVVLSKLPCA